jgi:dihydrofolate reductase
LAVATHIYLTEIEAAFEGDAHFPEFDLSQWQEVWSEHRPADEKNQYAMRFIRYQKL